MERKKIIFLVIDSLHPGAFEECLEQDLIPALSFLKDNGQYHKDCISCFPTMTPTASATIATGSGPDQHHIPAFVWYDREKKAQVNYGASPLAIYKLGITRVLKNLIYRMNDTHLSSYVSTIYEELAMRGIDSACINFFIYRGDTGHTIRIPWIFKFLTFFKLPSQNIKGSKKLVLGKLTKDGNFIKRFNSIFHKMGVNDAFSGAALLRDIKQGSQADFTLAYFPDTDHYIHVHNSKGYKKSIIRVDRQLQKILNCFPNWKTALERNIFVVCGDHSQSNVGGGSDSLINLDLLLRNFSQLKITDKNEKNKEIVICCNERMAIIEILNDNEAIRDKVIEELLHDFRIQLIMWKRNDKYIVRQGGSKSWFAFSWGGVIKDEWGSQWSISGDLSVLDGKISQGIFSSKDFPDALNRIKQSLDSRKGMRLLLSATPGYEFDSEAAPVHPGGGSHGSLHRGDSLVPLIITGISKDMSKPRISDLKDFLITNWLVEES